MANFGDRLKGHAEPVRTWRADAPSPHDLRRTVGTRLAELRIAKEIRDRVLNHAAGDVGSKHYNLHDYFDEKREALTRWSRALSAIIAPAPANVVPIRDHASIMKSLRASSRSSRKPPPRKLRSVGKIPRLSAADLEPIVAKCEQLYRRLNPMERRRGLLREINEAIANTNLDAGRPALPDYFESGLRICGALSGNFK